MTRCAWRTNEGPNVVSMAYIGITSNMLEVPIIYPASSQERRLPMPKHNHNTVQLYVEHLDGQRHKFWAPSHFETKEACEKVRRCLLRAGAICPSLFECYPGMRCGKLICPVCNRILRIKLLATCRTHRWHQRNWLLATIRLPNVFRDPGDAEPFDDLKNHPIIANFLQRLRRLHHKESGADPLLLIGAMEASFRTIANVPARRTLHAHFMISGPSGNQIRAATSFINNTPSSSDSSLFPVDTRPVGNTREDFILAMSYAVKQPILKLSFPNAQSRSGRQQIPKPAEIFELCSNFGLKRGCTDRLALIGIRYQNSRFVVLR